MKFFDKDGPSPKASRAPHGARGLKCPRHIPVLLVLTSRPARGAWIEIKEILAYGIKDLSRPARGAWIEIKTAGTRA